VKKDVGKLYNRLCQKAPTFLLVQLGVGFLPWIAILQQDQDYPRHMWIKLTLFDSHAVLSCAIHFYTLHRIPRLLPASTRGIGRIYQSWKHV